MRIAFPRARTFNRGMRKHFIRAFSKEAVQQVISGLGATSSEEALRKLDESIKLDVLDIGEIEASSSADSEMIVDLDKQIAVLQSLRRTAQRRRDEAANRVHSIRERIEDKQQKIDTITGVRYPSYVLADVPIRDEVPGITDTDHMMLKVAVPDGVINVRRTTINNSRATELKWVTRYVDYVSEAHSGLIDRELHLGRFEVTLTVTGTSYGGLSMKCDLRSLDKHLNTIDTNRGAYLHPHHNAGHCCLGNINTAIVDKWRKGDLAAIILMLDQYVHSFNAADAYIHASAWRPGTVLGFRKPCTCGDPRPHSPFECTAPRCPVCGEPGVFHMECMLSRRIRLGAKERVIGGSLFNGTIVPTEFDKMARNAKECLEALHEP